MKNCKEKPAVIFSHYVKYSGSNQRVCTVLQCRQEEYVIHSAFWSWEKKVKIHYLHVSKCKKTVVQSSPLQEFSKDSGRAERTAQCSPSGTRRH